MIDASAGESQVFLHQGCGPEIEGTRQSGALNFRLANIVQDKDLLELAKNMAAEVVEKDPGLDSAENLQLREFLREQKGKWGWSKIS